MTISHLRRDAAARPGDPLLSTRTPRRPTPTHSHPFVFTTLSLLSFSPFVRPMPRLTNRPSASVSLSHPSACPPSVSGAHMVAAAHGHTSHTRTHALLQTCSSLYLASLATHTAAIQQSQEALTSQTHPEEISRHYCVRIFSLIGNRNNAKRGFFVGCVSVLVLQNSFAKPNTFGPPIHFSTDGNCNSHFSPLSPPNCGQRKLDFLAKWSFFGSVVCPGTHILPQSDDTISPLMAVLSDSKGKMYKTPREAFKGCMSHLFKANFTASDGRATS